MNIAQVRFPFDIQKRGDERVFTYKKDKLGFRTIIPMLWPSLILSIFLAYQKVSHTRGIGNFSARFSEGVFYTVLFTLVIAVGTVVVLNLFRTSGSFSLNQQGVFLDGSLYPYKDIQTIYVKAPKGQIIQSMSSTTTGFAVRDQHRVQMVGWGVTGAIVGATGSVVSSASQISEAAGKGIVNSIQKKNFKICFRFGGEEKTLASGMSEVRALALLDGINTNP